MRESIHPIIAGIDALLKKIKVEFDGIYFASKYCPDTQVIEVLKRVHERFYFLDADLYEIRSQVEVLLDKANSDLLEDIEGPGDR